jgi:chromosome segregation ATPase
VRNGPFAQVTLVRCRKGFATMCKKMVVTALVIGAALITLHKLDLLGYVRTGIDKARHSVSSSIPPEVKLERLRHELRELPGEESKVRSTIAHEMVEVRKLRDSIAEAKVNLDKRQTALKEMKEELDKGTAFVTLDNRKIPAAQVKSSLARQWETFKTATEAVKTQEDLLKSREEALEVAKAKLDTMQEKRKELEAKVEKMDLELRKLRLAQTQHNIPVDDSQLANVMKLFDEVDTQIKTQQTELALQKGVDSDAAVEEALAHKAKTDQALKEMDDFFGSAKVTKK